ncbi:unnamed protein product [Phytophthora fragariaefolia]|uniref:Unnamed protein product n=1 Tax=Phytophthora fragariaefolia TaxID=1490495 RepID=A0A9W7D5E3_9STRA|nr:unnamed protein product [Phytophthora fragariaefolia]
MARGQSPLARAQARALGVDASLLAASPETLVSVMAPPSDAPETGGGSPSVDGTTEASVPSTPSAAPVAAPHSAADAPEAAPGVTSADCQPPGSVSSSGAPDGGTCAAADAPEVSSAVPGVDRFSSVRWEAIEDIVTAGTDRTVLQVQGSLQSHFLALARMVVDLNGRPPLRTDYELDRRLEAAELLSDVLGPLAPIPRSPAREDEISELRDDTASLEARLAAFEASLRRKGDLRLKTVHLYNQASQERKAALDNLQRLRPNHADAARQLVVTNIALEQSSQAAAALGQRCRRLDKSLTATHKIVRQDRGDCQSSASGGTGSAPASTMPAAVITFLEELGALQLVLPSPPATSGPSEPSAQATPAFSGTPGGAAATSGSSTTLTVDSDTSDGSGPIVPSALQRGKGKRLAKPSAKLRSSPPPPKKKQRLGRPSVDLKARKTAQRTKIRGCQPQWASTECSSTG